MSSEAPFKAYSFNGRLLYAFTKPEIEINGKIYKIWRHIINKKGQLIGLENHEGIVKFFPIETIINKLKK